MGNFCYHLCRDKDDPIKCIKCGDYYKPHYGGKSERRSCRAHDYKIIYDKFRQRHLFCKICNRYHYERGSHNCYHCYYID